MPSVKVYKQTGEAAGSIALDDTVFGAERNVALIHQVVVAQLANKRQGTKSALTRAEVARRRTQAVAPERHRQRAPRAR